MIGEQLYSFDRGVLRWLGAALGTGVVLLGAMLSHLELTSGNEHATPESHPEILLVLPWEAMKFCTR